MLYVVKDQIVCGDDIDSFDENDCDGDDYVDADIVLDAVVRPVGESLSLCWDIVRLHSRPVAGFVVVAAVVRCVDIYVVAVCALTNPLWHHPNRVVYVPRV